MTFYFFKLSEKFAEKQKLQSLVKKDKISQSVSKIHAHNVA